MDILLLFFLAIFLWKIRYEKEMNKEYLSPSSCLSWKGLLAITVVFHHLALYTDAGKIFPIFAYVGYLAVAVFFFFSGYGLQKKHISDNNYQKTYIRKRIPKILFPYILITIFFWILYALDGTVFSAGDILSGIIKVDPIAKFSWYIVVMLIFYFVFFLLMKIFQKKYNLMILGAALFCALWTALCITTGISYERYITAPLLVVGMLWATYEEKLFMFMKNHYLLILFSATAGFAFFFLGPRVLSVVNRTFYLKDFIKTLSAISFTLCVLLISLKFKIGNRTLDFMGKISFELYLSHGLFIHLFRSNILNIKSNLAYSLLVFISSTVFAFLFNKLFKIMFSRRKN